MNSILKGKWRWIVIAMALSALGHLLEGAPVLSRLQKVTEFVDTSLRRVQPFQIAQLYRTRMAERRGLWFCETDRDYGILILGPWGVGALFWLLLKFLLLLVPLIGMTLAGIAWFAATFAGVFKLCAFCIGILEDADRYEKGTGLIVGLFKKIFGTKSPD